jgi:hypothetical protein
MSQATHAYIARQQCGCVPCLVIDDEQRDGNAKAVASWIRKGWVVERVEIATVHAGSVLGQCEEHKKPAAEEARQGSML